MITWMLIGWPVLGAFGLVAWSCRGKADAATQLAEDVEQAEYLKAWMEHKHRVARKDKRGQHEAMDRLQSALHAKMRAELGR